MLKISKKKCLDAGVSISYTDQVIFLAKFYTTSESYSACNFLGFLIRSINETLTTFWASFQGKKISRVWWPEATEVGQWVSVRLTDTTLQEICLQIHAATQRRSTTCVRMAKVNLRFWPDKRCVPARLVPKVKGQMSLSWIRAIISANVGRL